jgi:hypothetical protein
MMATQVQATIRKKVYPYSNPERYRFFLKRFILDNPPKYYSAEVIETVETLDGPMFKLTLINDLTDPNLEPVGEVKMNGEYWYLWRNCFWAVAEYTDKTTCRLRIKESHDPYSPTKSVVLVVHNVGKQIEEDENVNGD